MSRVCSICGKGPSVGNVVVRKGSPKYKGGIGLSIRAMTMTDDEIKALEAEAAGETPAAITAKTAGSENLGGLSAAFDNAFANVEWQPGEAN